MNPTRIMEILSGLRLLPFFPSDEFAFSALVRMVGSMAENEQQVQWLVARMTSGIYTKWEGPAEMRACFCNRFKPKDGINAYSQIYETFPPDPTTPMRQIAGPEQKQLGDPRSKKVSEDKVIQKAIDIAVELQTIKDAKISGKATPEEIAAAPEWLRRLEGYEE